MTTTSPAAPLTPVIYWLSNERFRGIKTLSWRPAKGVNAILGGGDIGKTTILCDQPPA
jgi:putative ATP-dependent endonuclease of the OLD family